MTEDQSAAFEIGSTVQPRGGGYVVGELIEFNADGTGALIHWSNGDDIWKALRNLEVVPDGSKPAMEHGDL